MTTHPRTHGREPRGLTSVTDRMRAAARQAAEGVPRAELAVLYGVAMATVASWIEKVREADEDARRLAEFGG